MPHTHCQDEPFPFFELPAELRNNIYEFLIGDESEIRRLVPRFQNSKTDVVQKDLFPLASVCKRFRAEFLSSYFARCHAGIQITDLELFQGTFCRNILDDQIIRRQHPKAITIFVSGFRPKDERWFHDSIDILPFLKLRLECPAMSYTFAADPNVDWERCPPPPGTVRGCTVLDGVATRCKDLTSFVACDDEKWVTLIQGTKLANIFVHPWLRVNVELVFKEQPLGRRIDASGVRCYIPDARRFGLETVYAATNLEMKMKLKAWVSDEQGAGEEQIEMKDECE